MILIMILVLEKYLLVIVMPVLKVITVPHQANVMLVLKIPTIQVLQMDQP